MFFFTWCCKCYCWQRRNETNNEQCCSHPDWTQKKDRELLCTFREIALCPCAGPLVQPLTQKHRHTHRKFLNRFWFIFLIERGVAWKIRCIFAGSRTSGQKQSGIPDLMIETEKFGITLPRQRRRSVISVCVFARTCVCVCFKQYVPILSFYAGKIFQAR